MWFDALRNVRKQLEKDNPFPIEELRVFVREAATTPNEMPESLVVLNTLCFLLCSEWEDDIPPHTLSGSDIKAKIVAIVTALATENVAQIADLKLDLGLLLLPISYNTNASALQRSTQHTHFHSRVTKWSLHNNNAALFLGSLVACPLLSRVAYDTELTSLIADRFAHNDANFMWAWRIVDGNMNLRVNDDSPTLEELVRQNNLTALFPTTRKSPRLLKQGPQVAIMHRSKSLDALANPLSADQAKLCFFQGAKSSQTSSSQKGNVRRPKRVRSRAVTSRPSGRK